MKRFTTLVWDSNDYSEETLSGKGSTHVVNGKVIQRGRDYRERRESMTFSLKKKTQA